MMDLKKEELMQGNERRQRAGAPTASAVADAPESALMPEVSLQLLQDDQQLPVVFHAQQSGLKLAAWAAGNREAIKERLLTHGGILFRDFGVEVAADFEAFIRAISGELIEYNERSSPRTPVSGRVYTSTDYPADQTIFLHNENSYQQMFNKRIFFFCLTPPEKGGETPLADCRKVYQRISPEVRQRFIDKGWMYVRNYGDGYGLPWQSVFQTEDKGVVEAYCRQKKIDVEWKNDGRLRTRAVLPAVVKHPETGEMTWYNHATFFHVTTLEPWAQELLMEEFDDPLDYPTNTFYGDGTAIEGEVLDELRGIYQEQSVMFPWRQRDVLMLDNLMVAHGRMPYAGARKVLVGMSEPLTREDVSTS